MLCGLICGQNVSDALENNVYSPVLGWNINYNLFAIKISIKSIWLNCCFLVDFLDDHWCQKDFILQLLAISFFLFTKIYFVFLGALMFVHKCFQGWYPLVELIPLSLFSVLLVSWYGFCFKVYSVWCKCCEQSFLNIFICMKCLFYPFTFCLCVFSYVKWVSCTQHMYGFCLLIYSDTQCFLVSAFNPFIITVINDMYFILNIYFLFFFFLKKYL